MPDQTTVVRGTGEQKGVIGVAGFGSDNPTTVVTMAVWRMVLVRVARVYLQSLLGFLTVSVTGIDKAVGIPLEQFGGGLKIAAMLAVAPTFFTLAMNALEFLTKLDVTKPELRA